VKQAIILAAGKGTRLRPFTVNRPEALLIIAGKPIIQHVIHALAANNVTDIILVVGYHKEKIYDFLGDGRDFGVNIRYVTQDKQLGTANAMAQAEKYAAGEFLVLPGNKLIAPETIGDIIHAGPSTILIREVENPSLYGVVSFNEGKLESIIEKPAHPDSKYVNAGIYYFKKEIFSFIENELDIPDAINTMLVQGRSLNVMKTEKMWLDVIYPWDILKFNSLILEYLRAECKGTVETGVTLKGIVNIGANSVIRANTYILGPVNIGKGCEVGPNVVIFPSTSIGDNVVIAPFTEIKNTLIEDDVQIGAGAFIEDSLIDAGCLIGPHFSVCSSETDIKINEVYHKVKVGAMLGQSCQIGNNVTTESGSIIGNNSQIKSFKVINGRIPDGSLVV
jgi:UDP-N-acetylglucosamine diphosphorylase / glucose-1-phosphate thymidylyltransferase / UDP-N-acetylgalactosamine diphosphorylase / glucosamine-1-phosphate N-acetyltransferase / galactosamine-1-phosphate N-acetyltransferase